MMPEILEMIFLVIGKPGIRKAGIIKQIVAYFFTNNVYFEERFF
jgi:hypothetical protein